MKKTILIIVVALFVVGALGGGIYLWQTKKTLVCSENYNKYTSESLGIEFCYPKVLNTNQVIKVTEEGNKVFVYDKNLSKESGQSVEVFYKEKNDSLDQAIEKEFLADIAKNKCWVELLPSSQVPISFEGFKYPESYIFASALQYYTKEDAEKSQGYDIFKNQENCPQGYQATNGIRYFMMDQKNPDRFLFFSIGQYGIGEIGKPAWQETMVVK